MKLSTAYLCFLPVASAFVPVSRQKGGFALGVLSDPPKLNLVTKEANIKTTRRTKPTVRDWLSNRFH
jgi:hypothetical protein